MKKKKLTLWREHKWSHSVHEIITNMPGRLECKILTVVDLQIVKFSFLFNQLTIN